MMRSTFDFIKNIPKFVTIQLIFFCISKKVLDRVFG